MTRHASISLGSVQAALVGLVEGSCTAGTPQSQPARRYC